MWTCEAGSAGGAGAGAGKQGGGDRARAASAILPTAAPLWRKAPARTGHIEWKDGQMAQRAGSAGRLPRDVVARERLRRAQQEEVRAVSAVCAAQCGLAAARLKRDRAVAAADAVVVDAERELATAQTALVEVSGLDRAGVLLGLNRAALRRARTVAAAVRHAGTAA
jgi:hypothetical protein